MLVLYGLRVWLGRIKLEMARTASRLLGWPGARAWALDSGQKETRACACACACASVPAWSRVCVCVGCVSRGSVDGSRYQQISGVLAGTMKGERKQKRLLGVMLCRGSRGWAPRAFIVELGIG